MDLKEIRIEKELTQKEASELLNISLRSYKSYENEIVKKSSFKYMYLCEELGKYNYIDEEHGILKLNAIVKIVNEVLKKYNVNFCYLFGSYAKNKATEVSDVDLLIDTNITGLDFFGLIEELRVALKKKVDLLRVNQLNNNLDLTKEILKDGIKIYG